MKDKFVVDGMLGSLAKKLRIFGYDTVYDANIGDEEILRMATSEGRTVLTSDRRLFQTALKRKVDCILISEDGDEERLVTVFKAIGEKARMLNPQDARCPVCNGEVSMVEKEEVADTLPNGVLERQKVFYRCESCGKVYWIGSHWERLYELSEKIDRRFQYI